jgi:adenine-specific DNA-methyltransferase
MSPNQIPPYASTQLIAYIGNKRSLLPFLRSVFLEETERAGINKPLRFLDPFAGSGAVSRLARCLGWRVSANDAEEYAQLVVEAWTGVSADDLPALYRGEGGCPAVFDALNDLYPSDTGSGRGDASAGGLLSGFREPEPYMARHYAPSCTASADWRRERLFYTAENARFLDRVRSAIDFLRPSRAEMELCGVSRPVDEKERIYRAERTLLIGALLYEAATHANTSGVFKAFHKGFGGHGRDALARILAPMRLETPLLWPGAPAEVCRGDAAAFCSSRPADLCYLDPPYNQHQYGSNYHILNTLARWDRPPVNEERGTDGRYISIAGIPSDWTAHRSLFCSRALAHAAFKELFASIDAPLIVLSYNSDGIVDAEELYDLLADRADVSLKSVDYVAYRGGRQSASRRTAISEILFVARRRSSFSCTRTSNPRTVKAQELRALKTRIRLDRILSGAFDPEVFRRIAGGSSLLFTTSQGAAISLDSYLGLVLEDDARRKCKQLSADDAERLDDLLRPALLNDNVSACAAAVKLLESSVAFDRRLQRLALHWLRKIAHPKYEEAYRLLAERLLHVAGTRQQDFGRLASDLERIQLVFERRISGRK